MPTTGDEQSRLLDKFRDENALTWAETAARIGISETYLHRVRKGKQKFSRKVMHKLAEVMRAPAAAEVREDRDDAYGSQDMLRRENAELRERLSASERREAELLEIVRNLTAPAGRSQADAPARHASGANCGSTRDDRERRGA